MMKIYNLIGSIKQKDKKFADFSNRIDVSIMIIININMNIFNMTEKTINIRKKL